MFKPGDYVIDQTSQYQSVHRVLRYEGDRVVCRSVGRPHAGGIAYDPTTHETYRDPKKLSEYTGGFARR